MSHVATPVGSPNALDLDFEAHRRDLTGYCYRMLGSGSEAEDAVQETMVRAWRKADTLGSPAALKSWLYRIATNVCLDMLDASQRRARPMDLSSPVTADAALDSGLPEEAWVLPIADARVVPEGDPAEVTAARETIRLAFVAALQHLPPKQRAVLILREVLRWQASEVAELLDTSVQSINSALQRARSTMDSLDLDAGAAAPDLDGDHRDLLARYVQAFESYDVASLVKLIHEDATFSMPPYRLWLRGPEQVGAWMLGTGSGCQGSRLLTTSANGCPAVAIYRPSGPGEWKPFNLAVMEMGDGKITSIHNFLFTDLFPAFGLPTKLEA